MSNLTDAHAADTRALTPADLDARFDPFTAVVDAVPDSAWADPSPCSEWSAADVVTHVIDTERDFLGRFDVTLPQQADPDTPVPARWHAHVDQVRSALTKDQLNRAIDGYFGPTTVGATMVDFYGFDLIVHRWDVARAGGQDTVFTRAEMDAIDQSIALFGEGIRQEGVCGPAVEVAGDADRQTRLLAVLGRTG